MLAYAGIEEARRRAHRIDYLSPAIFPLQHTWAMNARAERITPCVQQEADKVKECFNLSSGYVESTMDGTCKEQNVNAQDANGGDITEGDGVGGAGEGAQRTRCQQHQTGQKQRPRGHQHSGANQGTNLSAVSDIAAGMAHSLLLLKGRITYSWGSGEHGSLGHGDTATQICPKVVTALRGLSLVQVTAGTNTSIFAGGNGSILSVGKHEGRERDHDHKSIPKVIALAPKWYITHVSAGNGHMLLLSKCGHVLSCGRNGFGQLGHGDFERLKKPKVVSALEQCSQVSAGHEHSLILGRNGRVFSCGLGFNGALGHSTRNSQYSPKLMKFPPGNAIVKQVEAGNNFSLFRTQDKCVFTCGKNDDGQLGLGDVNERHEPTHLSRVQHLGLEQGIPKSSSTMCPGITQLSAGNCHALLLAIDGSIFSCGNGKYGRLGHGNEQSQYVPLMLSAMSTAEIVKVAAGGSHSLFLASDGCVYSCGQGESGALGQGDRSDQYSAKKTVMSCNGAISQEAAAKVAVPITPAEEAAAPVVAAAMVDVVDTANNSEAGTGSDEASNDDALNGAVCIEHPSLGAGTSIHAGDDTCLGTMTAQCIGTNPNCKVCFKCPCQCQEESSLEAKKCVVCSKEYKGDYDEYRNRHFYSLPCSHAVGWCCIQGLIGVQKSGSVTCPHDSCDEVTKLTKLNLETLKELRRGKIRETLRRTSAMNTAARTETIDLTSNGEVPSRPIQQSWI